MQFGHVEKIKHLAHMDLILTLLKGIGRLLRDMYLNLFDTLRNFEQLSRDVTPPLLQ